MPGELGKFWSLWTIPKILLFCFYESINLKSRLLYFGLLDKMKKCIRPTCRKEQFSNTKSSPFLLFFYDNYLQMSLLYMAFSAGWQWELSTAPSLVSSLLVAPRIQTFKSPTELVLNQPLNRVWVPQVETESGAWLEICS